MALVGVNYRGQGRRGDSSKVECYYCHKFGHISHDCPVRKARNKSKDKVAAIAAEDGSDSDDAICFVGNAADNDDIVKSWRVDSAASARMGWMRACFDDYKTTTGRSVTMGDKGSMATAGVGTVVINVIVHGKTREIKLEKVLHVSTMGFVVPQSRGLPQKEGSNGRLSRSRDTRYGTRGPGSRADRNAKTTRHGLLAGDDGASHRRRPSS